jgi:hypothetical protein
MTGLVTSRGVKIRLEAKSCDQTDSPMRRLLLLTTLVLGTALSGCYISETPLIGARDAVFPYETIRYREANGSELMTMVHEGDAYVMRKDGEPGELQFRFKEIGKDLYLAQLIGDEGGKPAILYSVVRVDWKNRTADSYKAVADMADEGPGLSKCGNSELCIDDLEKYLTIARQAVATGKPAAAYEIVEAK